MMLTHQIKAVDLLSVVQREGIQLKGTGKYHAALCPFHTEKTPSFVVNTGKNRFCCYGCHEYGDVVDFLQKLHGFTFPDALAYLGIENRPTTKAQFAAIKRRIKAAEIRRERREAREARERELAYTLGTLIRRINKAAMALTPDNLAEYGNIFSSLPWYEWGHDTLINGNKLEKAYLLWSFKGHPIIRRGLLFNEDFDFDAWVRGIAYEEPQREQTNIKG